jgi:hypothetical protein
MPTFSLLSGKVAVNDVSLNVVTVPYAMPPVLTELIHVVLWELKPVPVIVTVISPLLGPLDGETPVTVGDAAAGIPTTTSRSRRTRLKKSRDRFMIIHLLITVN